MRLYAVVAIAGDNGETSIVGTWSSREEAQRWADAQQENDNPEREPDGMRYSACLVRTRAEWERSQ